MTLHPWPVEGVLLKLIDIVISVLQFSMCLGLNFFFWLQNALEQSLFPLSLLSELDELDDANY